LPFGLQAVGELRSLDPEPWVGEGRMLLAVRYDRHDLLEVARLALCGKRTAGLDQGAHLVGGLSALRERIARAAVVGDRRGEADDPLFAGGLERWR
jgi:hypothetical protein